MGVERYDSLGDPKAAIGVLTAPFGGARHYHHRLGGGGDRQGGQGALIHEPVEQLLHRYDKGALGRSVRVVTSHYRRHIQRDVCYRAQVGVVPRLGRYVERHVWLKRKQILEVVLWPY